MPDMTIQPHRNLAILALTLLVVVGSSPADNPAIVAEPRPGPWLKQHEGYVAVASRGGIDLLFLGDSITASWDKTAPGVWSRYYVPRKAANFAIGGDKIQNLLWRVDHGELDGVKPKVVVLMIGTNNLTQQTEDQIIEGIKTVIDHLWIKLPDTKILLLGLTPRAPGRDPRQPIAEPDPRVKPLNARLARLEIPSKLRYLDIGPKLLDPNGQVLQTHQPDFLHFSRKGYQIWADAMEPTLWEMMENDQ
jgi:lysophospholipase L1-like esterase